MSSFSTFQHFTQNKFVDDDVKLIVNISTHLVQIFDWVKINVFEQEVLHFFNHFSRWLSYWRRNDNDFIFRQISFHFVNLNLIDVDKFSNLNDETIEVNLISYFVLSDREKHRRHDERRRDQNVKCEKQTSRHEISEIYWVSIERLKDFNREVEWILTFCHDFSWFWWGTRQTSGTFWIQHRFTKSTIVRRLTSLVLPAP